MLFVYGPQTPIRLLEEIRSWKRQEIEHAAVIRRFSPRLEPEYQWLLAEWEQPLRAAERVAERCLNEALTRAEGEAPSDEMTFTRAETLLQASAYQSQRLVEHLLQILQNSPALAADPAAKSFVLHAVRESNGFLSMQETYRYVEVPYYRAGKVDDNEFGDMRKAGRASAKPRNGKGGANAAKAAGPAAQKAPAIADGAAAQKAPAIADGAAAAAAAAFPEAAGAAAALADRPAPPGGEGAQPINEAPPAAALGFEAGEVAVSPADAAGEDRVPAETTGEDRVPAEATGEDRAPAVQVPIGGHQLPPLPYAYNALEPFIDEKTMRIHHDKHHQSYVDGLNKAERELQQARQSGNFDLVKHWERELAFNGAGHYLHTLFWTTMAPRAGGQATGSLGAQIRQDFGSFEAFKKQFTEAANKVEGGGWAILVWSPRARRLEILTAEKHQNLSQWDVVPILPLDVWEHAYYLKHQNNRADYIKDWWNVVNWPYANERFVTASKLVWDPF